MRIGRFKVTSAIAALGLLASLACETPARADNLDLGGTYNTFDWTLKLGVSGPTYSNEGGGSISPSTLNGVTLPWVYCIDIPDNVGVPADYNNTTVTTDGTAKFGSVNPWTGGVTGTYVAGGSTAVAGEIAYILTTYASASSTPAQQEAIQASIWKLEYGSAFTVQTASVNTDMQTILNDSSGKSAALSSVLWLSPGSTGSPGSTYQALVTAAPEPSTFAIATLCGAGFIGFGLRRRKAMAA